MSPYAPAHLNGRPSSNEAEPIPLVIVEGFLSGAGAILWGRFPRYLNDGRDSNHLPRRAIFPSIGPVSSLHDRACELYYALRGGTVDYGDEHSQTHGHSRYGRTHPTGLYPQWSRRHRLHFLGHSVGGPTIMKLQFLLKHSHFSSDDHPDMIMSVSAVNSPFRGTQLVYVLGEHTTSAPLIRRFSIGSLIAFWVHLIAFFSPILHRILDLHTESRSLSYRDQSFMTLLRQIWSSDWAGSRDATPFDVTFSAADEREANSEGFTNPGTYYWSHTSYISSNLAANTISAPLFSLITSPLYLMSWLIHVFDLTLLKPTPSVLKQSQNVPVGRRSREKPALDTQCGVKFWAIYDELRCNDGAIPLFSQWHPLPCSITKCNHQTYEFMGKNPERGVWHVCQVEDGNHLSLLPVWRGVAEQKAFWRNMGIWLRHIDSRQITTCSGI